jgi:hypothetical protein
MKRILLLVIVLALCQMTVAQGGKLKATPCGSAAHCTVLTWTNPAFVGGGYIEVLRGPASGGETNLANVGQVTTYTDTAVTTNTTYFYTVEQCAVSAATGAVVCSAPSNEVSDTIPLATLSAPSSLAGSAN